MKRGNLKPKSAYNKFAKTEEHARWAIRRRERLKLEALQASQDIYPIEPLAEKDIESCDEISKAIKRWFAEYTTPGPNGISEADKAFLADLYTPQERFLRKFYEELDKERG